MAKQKKRSARKKSTSKKTLKERLKENVTKGLKTTAKRKGGVNIKITKQQGGKGKRSKASIELDENRSALAPGYRLSRNGNIYYESRKNRSDKPGKKV